MSHHLLQEDPVFTLIKAITSLTPSLIIKNGTLTIGNTKGYLLFRLAGNLSGLGHFTNVGFFHNFFLKNHRNLLKIEKIDVPQMVASRHCLAYPID